MREPNGCSTPAPKSSAAKQWIKKVAHTKEEGDTTREFFLVLHILNVFQCFFIIFIFFRYGDIFS